MSSREASNTESDELPVHLTRFIGRDRELGALAALARSTRLLALTGAGGSGKTRLARELAAGLSSEFARVVWIDLTPLADAELLAEHIGAALHARERADAAALRMLVDAIGDERLLLVLDNCEHLVEACASVTDALLRACPRLTVLATSREALGVASETAWLVPPLASAEATQLFVERAAAALPSFVVTDSNVAAIHEICRRLDGLPLAIELAAARVKVLSPEQIAARLDDAFKLLSAGGRTALPRHRTLRATMEWSFALLGSREQQLLRRLAVFAGSFTLDAAEAVCAGDALEVDDILDGVAALVDKSLVLMEPGDSTARYRVLETVRQYGMERLVEAGERDLLERRHAEHFLAFAEAAAPHLLGGAKTAGFVAQLAAEHDNVRLATTWTTADASRKEIALRFAGALFWFWYSVGQFRENRQMVDRALALDAPSSPLLLGRALLSSGLTALAQGDYAMSQRDLRASIELLTAAGDDANVGTARAKYGAAQLLAGDLAAAVETLDDALAATAHRPRNDMGAVFARFWRGWAAYAAGDFETAYAHTSENLAIGREFAHPTTAAHSLSTLARIELARGNIEEACAFVTDGLDLEVAIGDAWGVGLALDVIAAVAALRGRFDDALRFVAGTEAHRERLAMALPGPAPLEREQLVLSLRERLGDRYATVYAEGRALSTAELVHLALAEAARHTTEHRVSITADLVQPTDARPRLRVHALGPLQVFVGGQAIDAAAWGSARSRELLVYLLMHPDGRTKEQVGLAFWPEASSAQLRNNFHVTLHRLRRALGGAEWIGLSNDRYRVDPALIEEFDAASFERELIEARRLAKRQADGADAMLEQALSRYRGDLLDGESVGDWHLEHRDRLQRAYLEALMELGGRSFVQDRLERAADAYRRVLDRDPLHEEAALALMRCHAAAGDRAQALRVYRRIADSLRAELDAEPSDALARYNVKLQQGVGA